MIIIYDSEKPAHERVTIDHGTGDGPQICGAYDMRVEVTSIEKERAVAQFTVAGWGDAKTRAERHKAVSQAAKAAQG